MRAWAAVAILAKTRNLDGGFVADAAAGLPFLLEEGDEVALVPPQIDMPRRVHVSAVELLEDDRAYVKFAEICDASTAKALVGCTCLIKRETIDEEVFASTPSTWQGWDVIDEEMGYLGEIDDIIDNGQQALLSVLPESNGADQAVKPILIPIVDEFIIDVDVESRVVSVTIPHGLLEL